MRRSIFIARLLGPMFVVLGLAVLVHPDRFGRLALESIEGEGLLFLSGLMTLAAGLAIVNTHNRWQAGWPVIITVSGWLFVAGGVARLLLPGTVKAIGAAMTGYTAWMAAPGALFTAFGAYLAYKGYASTVARRLRRRPASSRQGPRRRSRRSAGAPRGRGSARSG